MSVEHANDVILACCVLHNFLRTKNITPTPVIADYPGPNGHIYHGAWREDPTNILPGIRPTSARNAAATALDVRDKLIEYFDTTGKLAWQDAYVKRV